MSPLLTEAEIDSLEILAGLDLAADFWRPCHTRPALQGLIAHCRGLAAENQRLRARVRGLQRKRSAKRGHRWTTRPGESGSH